MSKDNLQNVLREYKEKFPDSYFEQFASDYGALGLVREGLDQFILTYIFMDDKNDLDSVTDVVKEVAMRTARILFIFKKFGIVVENNIDKCFDNWAVADDK